MVLLLSKYLHTQSLEELLLDNGIMLLLSSRPTKYLSDLFLPDDYFLETNILLTSTLSIWISF